jgi:hypothetical protein
MIEVVEPKEEEEFGCGGGSSSSLLRKIHLLFKSSRRVSLFHVCLCNSIAYFYSAYRS